MPNMRTLPPAAQAAAIMHVAADFGLKVSAAISRDYNPATGRHDGKAIGATVTVETEFAVGDADAYRLAESRCNEVLRMFRQTRPGSTWGTTSDGVGGHVGLAEGRCRLNMSGVELRVARHFAG